jgi:transcriptional regulator of acetoin/glycerol metabolism
MQRQAILEHARTINAVVGLNSAIEPIEVKSSIARSWQRCVHDFGLDPLRDEPIVILDPQALQARQVPLQNLRRIAQAEMATLYQQLAGSGFSVLLTDTDGVVLDYLGDPAFTRTAAHTGMIEGALWNERNQGTNGMGTCIAEQQPVLVHQNEHFLSRNVGLTCSAAPIFNHDGTLLAVLDASSFSHLAQQHTLVLVSMSAQMIENRAFLCHFRDQYTLRFHSRPEFIGTLWEGILALDESGRILAANRHALFQLGYKNPADLLDLPVHDLFNTSLAALLDGKNHGWLNPVAFYEARQGNRFFGLMQPPEKPSLPHRSPPPATFPASEVTPLALDALQFGDATMENNLRCVRRVLNRDIPILLSGETGTGKELFALAIHHEHGDQGRPFIAVNCASIPETLIESELFGYRPGAFTGASREGRRGKMAQASGGTLFLDEIGDMPMALQARLLRVLEAREVIPLGGETPIKINIKLISATHRNLLDLVAEGRFREDLYYRLQGLSLTLPPLRDRQDKCALIQHILALECAQQHAVTLSEAALQVLEAYLWPGNIRQLRNVLRTALALHDGVEIMLHDLPGEIGASAANAVLPVPTLRLPHSTLEAAERAAILNVLVACRWNVTLAAQQLKISRNTLYRKMKTLDIQLNKVH